MKIAVILATLSFTVVSHAAVKAPHCKAIVEACKAAGFKSDDWKNGDGLWVHCINPILGKPANAKAPALKSGMTVPTVAASDVQACLSENPNFGVAQKKK